MALGELDKHMNFDTISRERDGCLELAHRGLQGISNDRRSTPRLAI